MSDHMLSPPIEIEPVERTLLTQMLLKRYAFVFGAIFTISALAALGIYYVDSVVLLALVIFVLTNLATLYVVWICTRYMSKLTQDDLDNFKKKYADLPILTATLNKHIELNGNIILFDLQRIHKALINHSVELRVKTPQNDQQEVLERLDDAIHFIDEFITLKCRIWKPARSR